MGSFEAFAEIDSSKENVMRIEFAVLKLFAACGSMVISKKKWGGGSIAEICVDQTG